MAYLSSTPETQVTSTLPSPYETTCVYADVDSMSDARRKEMLSYYDKLDAERKTFKEDLEEARQKNPGVPADEICTKVLLDRYVAEREKVFPEITRQYPQTMAEIEGMNKAKDLIAEIEPMNLEKTCSISDVDTLVVNTELICQQAIQFANSCIHLNLPTRERLVRSISLVKDRIHDLTNEREEYDALAANLGSEGEGIDLLRRKYEESSMVIVALRGYLNMWENELKDLPPN